MSNNRRVTLKGNQNIIVEFTNERIIPAGGLSVVGALLGKSDFVKKLNRMNISEQKDMQLILNFAKENSIVKRVLLNFYRKRLNYVKS